METNNSDDKKVYAVVEFASSEFTDKKDIDLVPSKWIEEEDGELLCQYPPVNDYPKLDKYTQELRDAKRDWAKYPVKILTYADTYAKGKKRLKRAYTTTDIRSTDDEHQQQNKIIKPTIISLKSVRSELNSISAMEQDLSISTIEENLKKTKTIPVDKLRPAPEVNEVFDFESLKEFFNTKIQEQNVLIHRYLTNEKKSLQYDIKKYFDEIKNTLVANKIPSDSHQSVSSVIEELGVTLPFKELEDFQAFDAALKSTASKKKALLALFRVKTYGEDKAIKCVGKMASAILTKNVEKHYSGTGKVSKGVGKLNFSDTETYACMKDTITEKFGDSEECKNFAGKVGRWLSGHGDREHGRKERSLSV